MHSKVTQTQSKSINVQNTIKVYLGGMWLMGVDIRTNTKRTSGFKEIELHVRSMLTILGSIVNIFG